MHSHDKIFCITTVIPSHCNIFDTFTWENFWHYYCKAFTLQHIWCIHMTKIFDITIAIPSLQYIWYIHTAKYLILPLQYLHIAIYLMHSHGKLFGITFVIPSHCNIFDTFTWQNIWYYGYYHCNTFTLQYIWYIHMTTFYFLYYNDYTFTLQYIIYYIFNVTQYLHIARHFIFTFCIWAITFKSIKFRHFHFKARCIYIVEYTHIMFCMLHS